MALRKVLSSNVCSKINILLWEEFQWRSYNTAKKNLVDIRPMIQKRIESRAKDYPIRGMIPVAEEVLNSRRVLIQGVSALLKVIPIVSCKFCPEVYIGEVGHLIQTCCGPKRFGKKQVHEWIVGGLKDILVTVEAFHLQHMFQSIVKHSERFDLERVPAVVELCWQAGADPNHECSLTNTPDSNGNSCDADADGVEYMSIQELKSIAKTTLHAWETLREGVQRLLLVYPAKVCKHCSEVHIGPSGHLARNCGVFKYESWRGTHIWKKAEVNDLVPPKIVWRRRPQDPPVLLNEGSDFYGHAPAVVDLCTKTGIIAPTKYNCMMKIQGLSRPMQFKD
ncbi:APO protein 4, mitochondrial [Cannabis sativa]|uniref:APO protein 4, mitochondrial n=1 Tax=Cannabis sativa TaxID=3483 RepID=UPI0029CA95EE|nr:APO protein 4, mitochondrial [Cannabis sativa]XP_060968263.1 APO protein 4, mitochondrial [Cannabis sativa]